LNDDDKYVRRSAIQHPIYAQHYPNGHEIINGKVIAK
jgi:hypothetical protein